MTPLTRYVLFVAALMVVVGVAVNPDRFRVSALNGDAVVSRKPARDIPSMASAPSHVWRGVLGASAIDDGPQGDLTATGGDGRITLWQLPDEKPVREIDAGAGFQVTLVRFVPGAAAVAGSGLVADGTGSIRLFDSATGSEIRRVDQQEPVVFMDFDLSGRYIVFTTLTTIKVWDLVEDRAVSVVSKTSQDAVGVFFLDDRYVLQSAPVSLYDWKNRKNAAGLNDIGVVDVKKVNRDLYAWLASNGLHTLRSPYGTREFVPFDTQGIAAFDLSPDGRWGVFLKRNKTMVLVECATGLTVQTVSFASQPEGVSISRDGANAFVVYGEGTVEVFGVGNENVFRKVRFQASRLFEKLWAGIEDVAKRRPWVSATPG